MRCSVKTLRAALPRLCAAHLWLTTDTFLSQLLIQAVLKDLGEPASESLLSNLLAEVRRRLVAPSAIPTG